MSDQEILLDALRFYEIDVVLVNGHRVKVQNDYEIEAQELGHYKLFDDGNIVALFSDLDELCWFILNS